MDHSDLELVEALGCLRGQTKGTLLVDGSARAVRYVVDPADGTLITVIDPRDTRGDEYQLCLPDDSFEAQLRALVTPIGLGDDGPWTDRHGAYHGSCRETSWVRLRVEHAKLASGPVVDGDDLMVPNAFAGEQTRLCAALNADRGALVRACERGAGVAIEEPFAVGVDPMGVDVRARFGVVRIAFDSIAASGDAGLEIVRSLA